MKFNNTVCGHAFFGKMRLFVWILIRFDRISIKHLFKFTDSLNTQQNEHMKMDTTGFYIVCLNDISGYPGKIPVYLPGIKFFNGMIEAATRNPSDQIPCEFLILHH